MFDCVNTEYLTECTEDDTKSLSKLVKVRSAPCYKDYHIQLEMCSLNPGTCLKLLYSMFLLQIYETVLFFYGASKQDFDARWKSLHSVKEALEDKVINL